MEDPLFSFIGREMKTGTKSLLFGVHQFILHPVFVALAWHRLYGWKKMHDLRLWVCFIVHDWGYWGCDQMDDPEDGEKHPELGARIVKKLFGIEWYYFCLYHSRFYAKRAHCTPSALCKADKLAFCMYPRWLYLLLATLTGEIWQYITTYHKRKAQGEERLLETEKNIDLVHEQAQDSLRIAHYEGRVKHKQFCKTLSYLRKNAWFQSLRNYMIWWVGRNKEGWMPGSYGIWNDHRRQDRWNNARQRTETDD
mgnify:CR=1 FL=1